MDYALHIFIMINIYIILSISLNLITGYTGLISICHAAFYGIGAYATTLLMMNLNFSFIPAVFCAVIISGILSYIIGKPSLRLKGDYFILATLGCQVIIFSILYNWVDFTRGPYGIPGIPSPKIFNYTFTGVRPFLFLSLVAALIAIAIIWFITNYNFGRVLKSIREDEEASQSLGKDTASFKLKAFVISAGIAAISGALFATYVSYIDPTSFTLDESIFIISLVVIGGIGNIRGPVIGTVILVILPEALRFLNIPDTIAPNVRQIIYGLLLILMMYFRPQGVAGEYKFE